MIDKHSFWIVLFFLCLGTFAIRASFILLSSKITISNRVKEIFSFIPAAILPAIITPLVFFHKGVNEFFFFKERFFILIVATFICTKTKSMFLTILFGIGSLYLLNEL